MMIPEIETDSPLLLPQRGSWPATHHVFEKREGTADAIRMALAAERPLLVRGEPGTGKSQLARAAAEVLGRVFISEVVHSRTEPQDLQWRFDAVSRLGEAQTLAQGQRGRVLPDGITDPLDPRLFLEPGVLWWVFGWASAWQQHQQFSRYQRCCPEPPTGWSSEQGAVLLIDEIDKADADLPNSLLEVLGNRAFQVPWIKETIGGKTLLGAESCEQGKEQAARQAGAPSPWPLVIITTNEERELPAAFVRRCLVLDMKIPDDTDEKLKDWLLARGRIHFPEPDLCADQVLEDAAVLLVDDRKQAKRQGMTPPGQAEYIDLIQAVTRLKQTTEAQCSLLQGLSRFAFKKYTGC